MGSPRYSFNMRSKWVVLLATYVSSSFGAQAFAYDLGPRLRHLSSAQVGPARDVTWLDSADVFFSSSTPDALKEALAKEGVTLQGQNGVLRARISMATLARVGAHFSHAELQPSHRPLLDKSVREIGADAVHAGKNGATARKGKGVLVGVLDTGVDLTHPAFYDENGRSRIIAVWDQDAEGSGPPGFGYGRVCDRGQIESGHCGVNDPQAHGTHVTGILAGSMSPHIGLAPEAEIVVVKSTRFTDVAGAVDWMFRVAESQGKPIVVNLSIGGHLGAHDGQSDLERALDTLQGPGKIIVAAAGNDGATPIHVRAGRAEVEQRAELSLPAPGAATATLLEIWEHGHTSPSFALEAYDASGTLISRKDLASDTSVVVSGAVVTYDADAQPVNGRTHHLVTVDLSRLSQDGESHRYVLAFRTERILDMWISTDDYRFGSAEFVTEGSDLDNFVPGDTLMTLTMPGTAKNLITVGSYVTKNQWASQAGRVYRIQKAEIATRSSFSSVGPTAAPEMTGEKPDLIAPGQLIAGPLSSSAEGVGVLAVDAHFAVMQGTSMSSPHVAGTVALMLEANPKLTPEEAKTILVETATTDSMLGSATPNDQSGFGRLNAQNALARVEGTARATAGCQSVPTTTGDSMAMVCMMMAAVFAQQIHARRMRLYRLRAMGNSQG
jgi:minor extracellular serine protease Vpr